MSPRRRALMGIARVFLGCAKAAPVGRGHEHPRGKKKELAKRARCRGSSICETQFPRHCRMFMAHLHRWALAFLGSGFGGSSVSAAESAPRQPVRLTDGLASLQGPSEARARHVAGRLHGRRRSNWRGELPRCGTHSYAHRFAGPRPTRRDLDGVWIRRRPTQARRSVRCTHCRSNSAFDPRSQTGDGTAGTDAGSCWGAGRPVRRVRECGRECGPQTAGSTAFVRLLRCAQEEWRRSRANRAAHRWHGTAPLPRKAWPSPPKSSVDSHSW